MEDTVHSRPAAEGPEVVAGKEGHEQVAGGSQGTADEAAGIAVRTRAGFVP